MKIMNLTFWVIIFVVSLVSLIKGADWLLESAEKIGFRLGFSSFVVGVLIVGFGTSLPELVSSIAAVVKGAPEIVVSNAVGSNIANILMIIGLSALATHKLTVSKNLIDSELPMLSISTAIFLIVVCDRAVTFGESFFLIAAYFVYLFYTISGGEGDESRKAFSLSPHDKVLVVDMIKLVIGLILLIFGAKYLVDSVVSIATMTKIATGTIAITAVALGTSLPELVVSLKAARGGKTEVAIGNIFGSNAFNALIVVGLPGIMHLSALPIGEKTFTLGIPVMALSTLIFVISGISKTIYKWEGMLFLIFYVIFILKLFELL